MRVDFERFYISDDDSLLDVETIHGFMQRSYWADTRPLEVTVKALKNSHSYGAFDHNNRQIGFARVITDGATMFYLADVFIDEDYRGQGIGKTLVSHIIGDYPGLTGILATKTPIRYMKNSVLCVMQRVI
ncbi:GNAT family N-acetyltransferase [Cohnella kolymensis]|uniref:GNAT family N-acetyltransferase n=1 Tax=Cohnella kolymensis TaxID=1590652 RepID=UPI000A4B4343